MLNDIIVVIGFIILVIVLCKSWNLYTTKRYLKSKEYRLNLTYGFYVDNMEKLEIVGVGDDKNGDYTVSQAIKKVDLTDDVRIKVNE